MKLLKRLINDKRGFSLVEALAATALVTIAASMSIGVFVSSNNTSLQQYEVNNSQNAVMADAEENLSNSSATAEGNSFVMKTSSGGSNGFSSLENNGEVNARYQDMSDDNVGYKVFKLDDAVGSEPATAPSEDYDE